MRKRIDELLRTIQEWQERADRVTAVTVLVVLIAASTSLVPAADKAEDVVHWIAVGFTALGAVVILSRAAFRRFGFTRPNRTLFRLTLDQQFDDQVREWLASAKEGKFDCKVRFCPKDCIDELTQLNYDAFKSSDFRIEWETLVARNRELAERNARIFMLIYDPLDEQRYIGYSSLVPINALGLKLYLEGKFKDAEISKEVVARHAGEAKGVLLFAIHLRPEYSFTQSTDSKNYPSKNYTAYFLACVRYHMRKLFGNNTRLDTFPPIYAQVEIPALGKRLRNYGFVSTKKKTGNGYEILVLEHPFRAVQQGAIAIHE